MEEILEKINSAKHIEIIVDKYDLYCASALYTYILTQHKKVSLVCLDKNIENKYSFLPWFEKIKRTHTPSADLSIKLNIDIIEFYKSFKNTNIIFNKKISTSLYGALVEYTDGFTNSKLNGMIFAIASELIEHGADYKLAYQFIIQNVSLAELRLKSRMLQDMRLKNNATVAEFKIDDEMLKSTKTDVDLAKKIMKEALRLPYINTSTLINSENEVIIKIDKEI